MRWHRIRVPPILPSTATGAGRRVTLRAEFSSSAPHADLEWCEALWRSTERPSVPQLDSDRTDSATTDGAAAPAPEMATQQAHEEWTDEQSPNTGGLAFIAAAAADTAEHPEDHPRLWSGAWFRGLFGQLVKFGLIGGTGMLVDMGLFNLLRATVFSPERVAWGPMAATVTATCVAIVWNWLGNRLWTFREHRRGEQTLREGIEFFGVSLAGMLIGLVPLWITHYGLGLTSAVADNISKLAGIGIGSVFRFVLYRWWVYAPWRRHRH